MKRTCIVSRNEEDFSVSASLHGGKKCLPRSKWLWSLTRDFRSELYVYTVTGERDGVLAATIFRNHPYKNRTAPVKHLCGANGGSLLCVNCIHTHSRRRLVTPPAYDYFFLFLFAAASAAFSALISALRAFSSAAAAASAAAFAAATSAATFPPISSLILLPLPTLSRM